LRQLKQVSCQSSGDWQLIVRLMRIVLLIGVSPVQRWVVTCALLDGNAVAFALFDAGWLQLDLEKSL